MRLQLRLIARVFSLLLLKRSRKNIKIVRAEFITATVWIGPIRIDALCPVLARSHLERCFVGAL